MYTFLPRGAAPTQRGSQTINVQTDISQSQEIGSAHTQTRNPDAVFHHLHFCMAATTITCGSTPSAYNRLQSGDTLRNTPPNTPSPTCEDPSASTSHERVLVSIATIGRNRIKNP
jgi:hypothetical protein